MAGSRRENDRRARRLPPREAAPVRLPGEPTPIDGEGADGRLPFGRRRRTAASALVAILVAFGLGLLLNAQAMRRTALALPFGGGRTARLVLVRPLADVSHWLFLDRPAELTASALGRPQPGPPSQGQVALSPSSGGKPAGKGGHQKPLQERPLPVPYKGHPMHLYIAGDSMMGLPGMALVNLSDKTKLIKPRLDYHISTGLCRPDFFNWPAEIQQQVRTFDPSAAVVMFGANDNQALQTPSGKIYQFGTAGWKKEYRKRVEDVIALFFQGGVRRVYWLGQPDMPSASFSDQLKLVDSIYKSVADKTFGVEYIDTWSLLSKNGQYSQYLPVGGQVQQVREQDGEHLTYAGGVLVAQAVMAAIKQEWFPKPGATPPTPSTRSSAGARPAP